MAWTETPAEAFRRKCEEIEIFCEPCFKTFDEKVEATHEAFNVEMCFDCYQEFNE